RRLARAKPRIQIPAKNAWRLRRQLFEQSSRLSRSCRVAEKDAPPRRAVFEMHVNDKERRGVETDRRNGRTTRLTLAFKHDRMCILKRAGRQDRVSARTRAISSRRREEERQSMHGRRSTSAVFGWLEILLQQDDVVIGDPTGQGAR